MMLISSNPGYMSESVFPRTIVKFHDRETVAEINEKRYMEAQKLGWRNPHAEKAWICVYTSTCFSRNDACS